MNIEKRVALLENRSHVNFAAISNKAMGLESGNVKIELSPAHGAIYFATNRKPLSECIHFDVYESDIKDVNSITFKDGREITGVVDSYTEDPTKVLSAVAIDEFAAHIGELESKVDEAEVKIEDHETRITSNTATIADHETRITNNTDKITENTNKIAENTNKIADHEERIVDNTMYIYTLNGTVDSHEERLKKNDEDVSNIITRLDYNESDLESTKSSLQLFMNQYDYDIADHDKRITTNTKNITHLEDTKADKSEILTLDSIYPVGTIVTGARPTIVGFRLGWKNSTLGKIFYPSIL